MDRKAIIEENSKNIVVELARFYCRNINVQYQKDLYLYIDEERETVKLNYLDFDNVGGNSWMDDDHITVASINWEYGDFFEDVYEDIHDTFGNDVTENLEEYVDLDNVFEDIRSWAIYAFERFFERMFNCIVDTDDLEDDDDIILEIENMEIEKCLNYEDYKKYTEERE